MNFCFETEIKKFLERKKIKLKQIPQDCIDFLSKYFSPEEIEKIKCLQYAEINFSDIEFRELLKKFGVIEKIYFGLSSPSLSIILIDQRLKWKEPMIVHEIVEKLKKDDDKATELEERYVVERGINGYDKILALKKNQQEKGK